ncbi:MAG: ABC transporter permease [Methylococcaceae bacterium]|nr:ABC transporter permease [Methylococcaceae bacterium]
MNNNIETISLTNLAYTLIPVFLVLVILFKWKLKTAHALYAMSRMILQLLVVGYFLKAIFASDSAKVTLSILSMMLLFSGWIALGTVKQKRRDFFCKAILSLIIACGLTLSIVILGVLELDPWYQPRYIIPLGGMILANCMNSISLAAERFISEINNHNDSIQARNIAFNASLIPTINTLFAVGLVSLPGMMTGQILSGVSPFIAARYQIMVMCMLFASSGLSTACFLTLIIKKYNN